MNLLPNQSKIIQTVNIRQVLNQSIHDFRYRHLKGNEYLVTRIKKNTVKSHVIDILENLNPLESKTVNADLRYIKTIIKLYGDKDIKAVKMDGTVVIYRELDIWSVKGHEYVLRAEIGFDKFINKS